MGRWLYQSDIILFKKKKKSVHWSRRTHHLPRGGKESVQAQECGHTGLHQQGRAHKAEAPVERGLLSVSWSWLGAIKEFQANSKTSDTFLWHYSAKTSKEDAAMDIN